jgi:hypothetical protein
MSNSLQASVAHIVAKLVSRRPTTIEELPQLVDSVAVALAALDGQAAPQEAAEAHAEAPVRRPARRRAPAPEPAAPAAAEHLSPPPPRLLRRAEVAAEQVPAPQPAPMLRPGTVRGIVKWFDPRTRRGALRLTGCSDEIVVEPNLLDEMSIQRLYKGQEVEATLSEEGTPRVVRLALPGGAWQVAASGGVVHNRHARPVLVELKREALKRVAARAEAELVLGRRGGR